jgi:crotonobetainyl-CoA:carnitine CoA-transferase CaiB-like acyl-CoA transferase
MAEMGADVIKLEPISGDVVRTVGPSRHHGMSATFMLLNEGKRSISADLSGPEGREIVARLARSTDIVVHNMRRSAADRIGLTYERLRTVNPRLIVAAAYGFAAGSGNDDRPAYDDVIQSESGIAWLQGVGRAAPQYVASLIADKTSALALAFAALAALHERDRTGVGQQVDMPMYEFMVSYTLIEQMWGEVFVPGETPPVYPRTVSAGRRPYETSDGYVSMMLYTDAHWRQFLKAIGDGRMFDDPRFATIGARTENIDEVYGYLAAVLRKRSTDTWLNLCHELGIPAGPVRSIADVLAAFDRQEAGIVHTYDHPTEGTVRGIGLPITFGDRNPADSTDQVIRPAPRLGEHSVDVLLEAGYSDAEIAQLTFAKVINDSSALKD